MDIKALNKEEYKGKELVCEYTTDSYYEIISDEEKLNFQFKLTALPKEEKRCFKDELFSEWLEAPLAFGAFENDELVGVIEGSKEEWNNRFRISNIWIKEEYRHQGLGSLLIQKMDEVAKKENVRMIVLETQTCNIKAIKCYQKNGFSIIGFDLYSYSNDDLKNHEVRIEMGKII